MPTIPTHLDELADLDVDAVADGQMLVWDATAGRWVPADQPVFDGNIDGGSFDGAGTGTIDGGTL